MCYKWLIIYFKGAFHLCSLDGEANYLENGYQNHLCILYLFGMWCAIVVDDHVLRSNFFANSVRCLEDVSWGFKLQTLRSPFFLICLLYWNWLECNVILKESKLKACFNYEFILDTSYFCCRVESWCLNLNHGNHIRTIALSLR